MSGLGLPLKGSYEGAFAHPHMAPLHVSPQSGSPMWVKGSVAANSTPLRVLPREVPYVRPRSRIPLLRADGTWGWVGSHLLIHHRIPGPRGQGPGKRPGRSGTPTWLGFR